MLKILTDIQPTLLPAGMLGVCHSKQEQNILVWSWSMNWLRRLCYEVNFFTKKIIKTLFLQLIKGNQVSSTHRQYRAAYQPKHWASRASKHLNQCLIILQVLVFKLIGTQNAFGLNAALQMLLYRLPWLLNEMITLPTRGWLHAQIWLRWRCMRSYAVEENKVEFQ